MEDLRATIARVRAEGRSRNVRCTAHDDQNASLSVSLGRKPGVIVMNCKAGCRIEDVIKAAGLRMADLFPPGSSSGRRRSESGPGRGLAHIQRAILRSRLPTRARHVAMVMALYADSDGTNIYPGVDRLRRDTWMSRATVMRAIAVLRDEGVLEVTRPGGGRGKPTIYRLVLGGNQEQSHSDTVSSPNGLRIAAGPRVDPRPEEPENAWDLAWSEPGNRLTSDPRVQVRTPDVVRGDEKKEEEHNNAVF